MRHRINCILLCIFCSPAAIACINEYRAHVDGTIEEIAIGETHRLSARFDEGYILQRLKRADSIYRATRNYKDFSDYGAMLIYARKYKEALEIFREIEKKQPGLYSTAANMGTVFELLGKPDSALFWIAKAVNIDPESHQGSEWIHIKVLKAKVKFSEDESELWGYDFLSLGFGNGKAPVNSENHKLLPLYDQLRFQIMERMFFVKPKDPILARLFFDFANVIALLEDVKSAMPVFDQAEEYGLESKVYKKRKAYFEELQAKADLLNHPTKNKKAKSEENVVQDVIFTGLFLAVIVILFFIRQRYLSQ